MFKLFCIILHYFIAYTKNLSIFDSINNNQKTQSMTAKQFNQKKVALYKQHGAEKTDYSHEVFIETKYGKMYISCEHSPQIKVANIHSLLRGTDEQKIEFKDVTGYDINTHNGKCNFYNQDPEYILNELDEYLDNLNYLKQ